MFSFQGLDFSFRSAERTCLCGLEGVSDLLNDRNSTVAVSAPVAVRDP